MQHKTFIQKFLLLVVALFTTGFIPASADDIESANIDEGWYYIKTTKTYGNLPAGNALYVNNGTLTWYYLNENDPAYIFKLEKSTDGEGYYLYNLGEDSWYKGMACLNTDTTVNRIYPNGTYPNIRPDLYFKKGTDDRKYLRFVQAKLNLDPYLIYLQEENFLPNTFYENPILAGGQVDALRRGTSKYSFYIDNPEFGFNYYDQKGQTANANRISESGEVSWRLHVTLQKIEKTDNELLSANLKLALIKAETLLNNKSISTLKSDNLLTSANQLSSQTSYAYTGSYYKNTGTADLSNLLNDKTYESRLTATGTVSSFSSPSYINMDLGKTVKGVQLEMKVGTSTDFPNAAIFPTDITIFGTNTENLNATSSDYSISNVASPTSNWTKIGDFRFDPFLKKTDINYTFSGCDKQELPKPTIIDATISHGHPVTTNIIFPDGEAYRYLRIYVNHTTIDYGKERVFQLSGLQCKELSDITATHGLQNDIETLRGLIASGNAKVKNGTTVDSSDVTALETAIKNISARRTVTIRDIGYATFVSDVNVTLPTGLTAYYVTATDNNKATLSEVVSAGEVLGAGVPVILKGDPKDEPYILTVVTGDAKTITETTNLLQGTAAENQSQTDGTTYYVLSKNSEGKAALMRYNTGNTLKAGYAYLVASSGSPAFLNLSFSDPTGIHSAVNEENGKAAKTYDLEGRSVKNPQKGIYIQNGKKVIIK